MTPQLQSSEGNASSPIGRNVADLAIRSERSHLGRNLRHTVLGTASLELRYDPAHLTVERCTAASSTEMRSGACNVTPGAGSARLNYAAVNGIQPDAILAELTFAPVGGYNMEQLANDLDLHVNNAFALDGTAFVWPESPPVYHSNYIFLPLVMRGQ
jgi:hypothetical protein